MGRSGIRGGIALGGAFVLLTMVTQVGGLALIAASLQAKRGWRRALAVFALSYLALIPLCSLLAPVWGRVPLPCLGSDALAPSTLLTCVLHRNYASTTARKELAQLGRALRARFPEARLRYLDAGFPFVDGFPLLPHLSHRDGRKVDLAFFYRDPPSWPIGYFNYESPGAGEVRPCRGVRSLLRWDFDWLQTIVNAPWDPERTGAAIQWLVARPSVERIFIEPHLRQRLSLASTKVRFQGCRAARHDDHFHVEFAG